MLVRKIKKIDELVFNNSIQKLLNKFALTRRVVLTGKPRMFKIYTEYEKNYDCKLSQLLEEYGSDKGYIYDGPKNYSWSPHTYADFYSRLFWQHRDSIKSVFECGLGSNDESIPSNMGSKGKPGASLRAWRDYFPNSTVYGADVDKKILFTENRIQTFYVNQLDTESIDALWSKLPLIRFDFMIDDGLHTFEAGSNFFTNSIYKLTKNGIYVIEDVNEQDIKKYKKFFGNKKFYVEFVRLYSRDKYIPNNNLVLIRQPDRRL